jgi:hypothetical protein
VVKFILQSLAPVYHNCIRPVTSFAYSHITSVSVQECRFKDSKSWGSVGHRHTNGAVYQQEVGTCCFFLSPLIANSLAFLVSALTANPLFFHFCQSAKD